MLVQVMDEMSYMPRSYKPKSAPKPKTPAKQKTVKTAPDARRNMLLTAAQHEFVNSDARFTAFVSGLGGGKSFAGAVKLLRQPPNSVSLVIAASYRMLTTATQTTFWRVVELLNLQDYIADHNKSEQITTLTNGHVIHWRSASEPDLLRGLEVSACWIDEAAYCSEEVFDIALSRVRLPGSGQTWLTTTPNGKNWVYRVFMEDMVADPAYRIIRARTVDNHYLPKHYVATLTAKYSSTQALQELDAEFLDKGGSRIRAEWIRKTNIIPHGPVVVGVDLASSTSKRADYTACVAVVNGRGAQHVLDAERHREPFHTSMEQIISFAKRNRARQIIVERVQYQSAAVAELQRLARGSGIAVRGVSPQGSKLMRFLPIEGRIESGTITFGTALPQYFHDELLDFSGQNDLHDDMIDALVYACEHGLSRNGGGLVQIEY